MEQAKQKLQETIFSTYIYEIVRRESEGLDSIYEDYIVRLVGEYGLHTLLDNNALESCGVVNDRRLYVLC